MFNLFEMKPEINLNYSVLFLLCENIKTSTLNSICLIKKIFGEKLPFLLEENLALSTSNWFLLKILE